MKKNLARSLILLIIGVLPAFSFVGCSQHAYACKVIESESIDVASEKDNTQNYVLQIGQSKYNTIYLSSKKSKLTNDTFDIYGIAEESSTLTWKRIKVNAKTGEIIGFSNISPLPAIKNINKLSDVELKQAAELTLAELVNFEQYNHFEMTRPDSSTSNYYMVWQVKRELMCNIKVEISINSEGSITSFSKTEACPSTATKSFISSHQRDELLEEKIREHLGVDTLDGIEYTIQSEILSYCNNLPAILYSVNIVEDGFSQLIVLAIYQTQ